MFELYKKRNFSAMVTDTFDFIKKHFGNYVAGYLTITGGFLMVLCLIFFFFVKDFMSVFSNSALIGNPLDRYFGTTSSILLMLLIFVIGIIFTCVTTCYPIAYLNLVAKTGKDKFTASEILSELKGMIVKIIIFSLLSIISFVPLAILIFGLSFLLFFILIGIPLIMIVAPAFFAWGTQSLFVYMTEEIGYFDAMGRGWKIVFSKDFWPVVGNTVVSYLSMSIVQTILSAVPYIMMIVASLHARGTDAIERSAGYMITFYMISIVSSYFMNNLLLINQGIIYYSSLEVRNNVTAFSEIDQIGQDVE